MVQVRAEGPYTQISGVIEQMASKLDCSRLSTKSSHKEETVGALLTLIAIAVVVWLIVGKTPSSQSSSAPKYDEDQTKRVDAWMKECSQKVQVPRMICGPVPQGFDGDEEVFAVFPNVALYEPRAVRYSRGYYGVPTIRLRVDCHSDLVPVLAAVRVSRKSSSLMSGA
jgi:hypothetical protein